MITNKYIIREQNEALVLKSIIENKYISRAQITTTTRLNKASVSSITKSLIDQHLVNEIGIGEATSQGGRKPIQLALNEQAGIIISLDVGYNYILGMISYLNGHILQTVKYEEYIYASNCISSIQQVVSQLLSKAPDTFHGVVGMAVAIHGIISQQRIVFTPHYDLDQLDVYEQLSRLFEFPIYLENEANLAVLGEYTFSVSGESIISISSHSGIGAGIIIDGVLQNGTNGQSGEFGHTILYPNGLPCSCGNKGCIELYASNKVLFDAYAQAAHLSTCNSDVLTQALTSGDEQAIQLLQENAQYLAIGINNLIMLYNPELIIVNSSVYRKNPQFIHTLKQQLPSKFVEGVHIQAGSLGEHATLFGGVALVSSQFLNVPKLKFLSQ